MGIGFRHVKGRVERIEKLDAYWSERDKHKRMREILARLKVIELEHDQLTHELFKLAPEMFLRGGAGEPIHPPGDAVADISDYCPDYEPDDFDESTGRGMLPAEVERRFDDFSRWSARSLDLDTPGYDPPGVNEYDEYGYQSDTTYPPH